MNRLCRIGINYGLTSLIPILSWFVLGLIVDKDLSNIFSLTYPLQFIYGLLMALFGTGASIHYIKDKNKVAIKSGIILGIVIGAIVFGCIIYNISAYTSILHMTGEKYELWGNYSIICIYFQLLQSASLNKFYADGDDAFANTCCITCNILNFIALCILAYVCKENPQLIVICMLILNTGCTLVLLYLALAGSPKGFDIDIKKCARYESSEIATSIGFFFIFLIGLSNTTSYGLEYTSALNFVCLITDTQYDMAVAICTVAKLEISQKKFHMKKSMKNAYIYTILLVASSVSMLLIFGPLLHIPMGLAVLYFCADLLNFGLFPYYKLRLVYLQLECCPKKTTITKCIADGIRIICSCLATPFCTNIGQVISVLFQTTVYKTLYRNTQKQ